ncbi:hypothetical protein Tco_0194692 [Tanacetum coccineum]
MNQNYYDLNLGYNSNSSGFDQYQPPQYSITHQPPQEKSMAELLLEEKLPQALHAFCEKLNKYVQEKQEEKNNAEEQAAKVSSQYWKPPIYYDDDNDDEESSIPLRDIISELPLSVAIAPVLPTKEPDDSLSMGDEHLSTISETESDKVIKSSVKDIVPIPSESEDLSDNKSECDMPFCDESSTIPQGNDSNHFDAESDLIESLLNRDTSIVYSPKIDSLLKEFTGKLAYIDLIPPEINKADFNPKDDNRLVEQLLYDNSPPLDALKDHFEIFFDSNDDCTSSDDNPFYSEDIDYVEASPPDSELVSLEEVKDFDPEDGSPSSFPIPVEDSDYFLEKSKTFLSLPELETFRFDIEEKNSGSTTIHADISLLEYDCFYFEIEPELGELTRVVVEDIYDNSTRELRVYVPNIFPPLHPLSSDLTLLLPLFIRK